MYRESGISPYRVLEPYVLSNPVSIFVWRIFHSKFQGTYELMFLILLKVHIRLVFLIMFKGAHELFLITLKVCNQLVFFFIMN